MPDQLTKPPAEPAVVALRFHDLSVSPREVARYAGGVRYRPDESQSKRIQAALDRARCLIKPMFCYRIREVHGVKQTGWVDLGNDLDFPLPREEDDADVKFLVFCLCTIGGSLEESTRALLSEGAVLDGLFLDAAGVALLETLSTNAYGLVKSRAEEHHLRVGCGYGPGYEGIELSLQKRLFELVDASRIGVALNESYVMSPAKSLSFVIPWTTSAVRPTNRYKCASCTLKHCSYRLSA